MLGSGQKITSTRWRVLKSIMFGTQRSIKYQTVANCHGALCQTYDDFSTPCFDGRHHMIMGGSFISLGVRSEMGSGKMKDEESLLFL